MKNINKILVSLLLIIVIMGTGCLKQSATGGPIPDDSTWKWEFVGEMNKTWIFQVDESSACRCYPISIEDIGNDTSLMTVHCEDELLPLEDLPIIE